MNKYKVTIEFHISDLENIPDNCSGTTFSFQGILKNFGNVAIEGDLFTLNIDKSISENENNEISEISKSEMQDCLVYDVTEEDSKALYLDYAFNYSIKNMKFIPGVICMSFKNGPIEYTVSTFTQYVRNTCQGDWLNDLEKIIIDLNITDFYAIGENQQMLIRDYVTNVPLYIWHKPKTLSNCPKCLFYGCSQYKTKIVLYEIFIHKLIISCE